MKASGLTETIHHQEEIIFGLVLEDSAFPQLNRIWEAFYDGPQISSEQANNISFPNRKRMGSNAKYKDSVFDEFVGLSEVGVNIFDAVGTESRGVWSREMDLVTSFF
ncbi:MAG: hypothetical protein ACSHYA_19870 [Opitutaceae bacterium]